MSASGADSEGISIGSSTSERFYVSVQHKPLFRLFCSEAYLYAHRGSVFEYDMEVERLNRFDGPIFLQRRPPESRPGWRRNLGRDRQTRRIESHPADLSARDDVDQRAVSNAALFTGLGPLRGFIWQRTDNARPVGETKHAPQHAHRRKAHGNGRDTDREPRRNPDVPISVAANANFPAQCSCPW